MFDRFTERARHIVVFAQEEAGALRFSHTGSEALLLGLLREEEGVAADVLESLCVSLEKARVAVTRHVASGEQPTEGFTASAPTSVWNARPSSLWSRYSSTHPRASSPTTTLSSTSRNSRSTRAHAPLAYGSRRKTPAQSQPSADLADHIAASAAGRIRGLDPTKCVWSADRDHSHAMLNVRIMSAAADRATRPRGHPNSGACARGSQNERDWRGRACSALLAHDGQTDDQIDAAFDLVG